MKSLQVPTRPVAVEVFTSDGSQTHGLFYLEPSRFEMHEPNEVLGVLNDDRMFIPFAAADPENAQRLLNKDHIVRARIDDIEPGHRTSEAFPCGTVLLVDGSRLTGNVVIETPPSASRLLDKLNQAPRFISIVTEDGINFVQRSYIACVY